jgi:hypothetical protein
MVATLGDAAAMPTHFVGNFVHFLLFSLPSSQPPPPVRTVRVGRGMESGEACSEIGLVSSQTC